MKLVDRYIIRQYITTFLFILGAFLVICIVVDVLEKIDVFLDERPPMDELIFDYYLNFIAYFGNLLAPICIFLGVIFFTSRMAARTEIVPVLSAGVRFRRLLQPYLIISLLTMGASFVLKSYIIPNSTEARLAFEYTYMKKQKKRVVKLNDIHKKVAQDTYVYFHHYNERSNIGTNFGMEKVVNGAIESKLNAKSIRWVDSTDRWRLDRVEIREFGGKQETIRRYKTMDTTFLLTPEEIFIKEQFAESMTLPKLLNFIEKEELRGSDILDSLYLERHRRYSDPLAVLILSMLGFAISFEKSRGGIAVKIGIGILLCFIYVALLYGGAIIVGEEYPPWLAVWMPNFFFGPITILLLLQGSNPSLFHVDLKSWFKQKE
ncbi:MAG: LptF/LptG family permease [Bacteroidota bacterium]